MTDEIDRQSAVAFYNVGITYLDAADELARRQLDRDDKFRLSFDLPIRHSYAQAWELIQKACLRRQGIEPKELKLDVGHKLTKAWDLIDKLQFAALNLTPDTRTIVELLDNFHPTKLYAYPFTGARREIELKDLGTVSQRLRLPRSEILRLFVTD
jgi:hypothetical protein